MLREVLELLEEGGEWLRQTISCLNVILLFSYAYIEKLLKRESCLLQVAQNQWKVSKKAFFLLKLTLC